MKLTVTLSIFLIAFFLYSCGGDKKSSAIDDIKNAVESAKDATESIEKVEDAMTKAQKKWEERKAAGDTLALHFTELQKFLPDEVPGYTAEKPQGETLNLMGFSSSQASRRYIKEVNGKKEIVKVTIHDFNSNQIGFSGATTWLAGNFSYENDNEYTRSFDVGVEDCYGHEQYDKRNRHAEVMIAVGYRFLVDIEAENQDGTDVVKSFVKYIDIKKLANM